METLFDQYKELNINGSLICLEQVEDIYLLLLSDQCKGNRF